MFNTQATHSSNPIAIFRSIKQNWSLILDMTKREIKKKYRGAFLGLAWSFINPLLMLIVYTFVFSFVFKARWGLSESENRLDFAITLFAGLIVFGIFSESIQQSAELIINNANYVKRVIFPLEILSVISVGSIVFNAVMSTVILLLMQLFLKGFFPLTVIFFPLIVLPVILLALGASWFFSALGVYLRDVDQLLGFLTTLLLFTSAIFFPLSALPENYQKLLRLNPLVILVEESRKVLVHGQTPDWLSLAIPFVLSGLVAWIGFWWFQKTRKGFADVL